MILKLILSILLIGLFLYSKLLPYKDKLNNKYKGIFNFFNAIFSPILNFFKSFIKPFVVGQGLSVDMTQVLLFAIFIILLNLFR